MLYIGFKQFIFNGVRSKEGINDIFYLRINSDVKITISVTHVWQQYTSRKLQVYSREYDTEWGKIINLIEKTRCTKFLSWIQNSSKRTYIFRKIEKAYRKDAQTFLKVKCMETSMFMCYLQ